MVGTSILVNIVFVVNWKSLYQWRITSFGLMDRFGKFTKSDQESAFLHVEDVPANTFVEIRVLLPSTYFHQNKKGRDYLRICCARRNSMGRSSEIVRETRRNELFLLVIYIKYSMVAISIFLILLYFFLYSKYGRARRLQKNLSIIENHHLI